MPKLMLQTIIAFAFMAEKAWTQNEFCLTTSDPDPATQDDGLTWNDVQLVIDGYNADIDNINEEIATINQCIKDETAKFEDLFIGSTAPNWTGYLLFPDEKKLPVLAEQNKKEAAEIIEELPAIEQSLNEAEIELIPLLRSEQ